MVYFPAVSQLTRNFYRRRSRTLPECHLGWYSELREQSAVVEHALFLAVAENEVFGPIHRAGIFHLINFLVIGFRYIELITCYLGSSGFLRSVFLAFFLVAG